MPKVWNIGNTTARNPKRIENALKVFLAEGFSGNAKSSEIEARLHAKLKERGVLEFEGESSDWNGRKWRAAFYQLGFISFEKYKIGKTTYSVEELFKSIDIKDVKLNYEITPTGKKLVNALSIPEIDEIYTRQFSCHELPNSLEENYPEGKMKPFILFLEVLFKLQENGLDGLTKLETELFLQKFQNHDSQLSEVIYNEILVFRSKLVDKSHKDSKEIINSYLQNLYDEVNLGLKQRSIKDYADTTFRYFSLSGLFTRIGKTLVIRSNKIEFVKKLLGSEPNFLFDNNPYEYFKYFYNNSYLLPTDNNEFALLEIENLKSGIRDKKNQLLTVANKLNSDSDINEIKNIRFALIEYNNWEIEEDFANEQQSEEAIIDILNYLKVLNGESVVNGPEIDDRPAYLEWAVWRSFLAIDDLVSPVHETRRFPVDQDFHPRNTAPGGGADLLFEFETYVLVVEVTLTSSHRQMAVESEPVRRHTVQYKEQYPGKDVYCLFIAPSVDNNVIETFRIGVWYKGDEEEFVNIVPMNLSDFIVAIETLTNKKYHNSDFKTLIERCLVFRNVRAPQWKTSISKEVDLWKRRVLAI